MKTYKILLILLGIIFCDLIHAQNKQTKDSTYLIESVDGNTYTGELKVIELGKLYELKTSNGVLTFKQADIKFMKSLNAKDFKKGNYWPANPHTSRYFYMPSGYGLRKGEGYYQNAWVWFNQVSYGFTDNFSMGVGIIPTFLLGITEVIPIWLTPKLSFPYKNNRGAFGLGTILFSLAGKEGSTESIGILYGSNTFGTRDKQLSIGLGLGYDTQNGFSKYPAISLGGLVRTSKKWAFITENYLFITSSGEFGLISGGFRYMAKKLSIDIGGFIPLFNFDRTFILPWLSITVPFGKRY